MENQEQLERYQRARLQVDRMKKFFRHLRVYIVVNVLLIIFKLRLFRFFTDQGIRNEQFYDWLDWNIIGTPVLWGVGLAIHAFYVFVLQGKKWNDVKPGFIVEWEERQIKKYLDKD
jgi:hypothetical protein